MKELIKTLESLGQTQSINQDANLSEQLTGNQLAELARVGQDLTCTHHPGDDDDDNQ